MPCLRRCRTHSTALPLTTNGTLVLCQRHCRRARFGAYCWVDERIGERLGGARIGRTGLRKAQTALQIEIFRCTNFPLKKSDKSAHSTAFPNVFRANALHYHQIIVFLQSIGVRAIPTIGYRPAGRFACCRLADRARHIHSQLNTLNSINLCGYSIHLSEERW